MPTLEIDFWSKAAPLAKSIRFYKFFMLAHTSKIIKIWNKTKNKVKKFYEALQILCFYAHDLWNAEFINNCWFVSTLHCENYIRVILMKKKIYIDGGWGKEGQSQEYL